MDSNDPIQDPSGHLNETQLLSHTPSRRQQFKHHEINPLLSDLSPASTLEALAATDAVPAAKRHRQSFIQKSVATASTSERAWGIKAAFAGKKLREWYTELSAWSWVGFERRGDKIEEEAYSGSLPLRVVEHYETRIEVTRDDMETLEVEELKNYVRSILLDAGARDSALSSNATEYEHLGDFKALITATIVQTLPMLSRLMTLLDKWTTRLLILRQVPVFIRALSDARESMLSAWLAVGEPDLSTAKQVSFCSRKAFEDIQAVLQDQLSQLGRKLDVMLDLLEASQDVLPEKWVDSVDGLEDEYSSWVVKGEEVLLQSEMDASQDESQSVRSAGDAPADIQTKADGGLDELKSRPNYETGTSNNASNLGSTNSLADLHETESRQNAQSEQLSNESPSQYSGESKPRSPKIIHRPPHLELDAGNSSTASDHNSDTSHPGSASSAYFSDKSSPEIRNASVVEYIGSPTWLKTPWSEDGATPCFDNGNRRASSNTERVARSPLPSNSTHSPSLGHQQSGPSIHIPKNLPSHNSTSPLPDPSFSKTHTRTRSASMQSFEVVPKSEIREILVRRSESFTPALASPSPAQPNSPAVLKSERDITGLSNEVLPLSAQGGNGLEQSPTLARHPDAGSHELHKPMMKDQPPTLPRSSHRFQQISDLAPGSTPVEIRKSVAKPHISSEKGAAAQTPLKAFSTTTDDQLEARISSILTEIPANIRLTSGPEPDAPEINRFSAAQKTPLSRTQAMRLTRAQTSITPPTMTLAPVQPKSSKSRSPNGEPEIKLYHLHQSGKDVPVKLFVRLVGEAGERVMVRIGGGWADLAEYLKEYASHHGRRSVSDTRFDIHGIPSSSPSLNQTSSPSNSRPATPISTRPKPAHIFNRQQTTPGKFESPHTPTSDPSVRSASRLSWTDEDSPSLGLAGPKTKNVEMSPAKQAWVDEMVEQAKGGGGAAVGEVGVVGGTKRVFLKEGRRRAGSNV